MLNATDFQTLAQPATPTTPEQLESALNIARTYPWFADAHILTLKMLKQQNHPTFAKQRTVLSLYASNRKMLLEYLHSVSADNCADAIEVSDL